VHQQSSIGGWILIGLGVVFLLEKLGLFSWYIISELWPLILIAVGLNIVIKHKS
jgi:hypothetical protein